MMSKWNGVGFADVGGKRLLCEKERRTENSMVVAVWILCQE